MGWCKDEDRGITIGEGPRKDRACRHPEKAANRTGNDATWTSRGMTVT